MKIDIWVVLENLLRIFKCHWNQTRITCAGTLHADRRIFCIISRLSSSYNYNVSNKSSRGNQNTHFMFNNFFYCAVCEIMWKTGVELGGRQRTIWRMCIACWVQNVTNTHSEHAILIASPPQQRLHERCLWCSWKRNQDAHYLTFCSPHNPRPMAVSVVPKPF
jgi:hypothetical protein